ncbi:MAG: hypothetical protein CVU62_00865 [Deltaproteobacteria bacterium HGW-Deltaproteobacteria-2]|jgi:opacity protein-like surface antigen|nr:MAG: hypothetical protein CVU62_00865 [Deltaproteobacteria bacterium HGW-Deltaproteobacteria-2]
MKKTFSVVAVMFMLLMLPGISLSATTGPYISAQLGGAYLTDSDYKEPVDYGTMEFKLGFAGGFAGGYNFGMFRVEGEIGYQRNEMDKASVCSGGGCISGTVSSSNMSALSGLANAYIDFVNSSPVTPYISGGIGVAKIDLKISDTSFDSTVFAYQVGAGVAFAINPHMSIDLKYRYFATADPKQDFSTWTFASHNIYFGFRYNF